jgi:hypothetical protein
MEDGRRQLVEEGGAQSRGRGARLDETRGKHNFRMERKRAKREQVEGSLRRKSKRSMNRKKKGARRK